MTKTNDKIKRQKQSKQKTMTKTKNKQLTNKKWQTNDKIKRQNQTKQTKTNDKNKKETIDEQKMTKTNDETNKKINIQMTKLYQEIRWKGKKKGDIQHYNTDENKTATQKKRRKWNPGEDRIKTKS